jgi:hypothetical protein
MTRLKLAFINLVIVVGAAAIIWMQWPEAMKPHGYGYAAYEPGLASRVFLAILLTGIPVLLYAVVAHVFLSHFLFAQGEVKAFRARKLVESIGGKDATEGTSTARNDGAHNSLN